MAMKRLHYFQYQYLQKEDFQDEQTYHLSMRRRHNELLHTWGIASGLEIDFTVGENEVRIRPGMAVDSQGREIIVESDHSVDLTGHADTMPYLVIRYKEEETDSKTHGGITGNTRVAESFEHKLHTAKPSDQSLELILGQISVTVTGAVDSVDLKERTEAGAKIGEAKAAGIKLTIKDHIENEWPALKGLEVSAPGTGLQGIEVESKKTAFFGSLTTNGNVGIGTTNPLDTLDVNGDIRVRGADIKDAGGTARITLTDNGRLDLKEDGGATVLSIATNGYVGIGTTTPKNKLDVEGGAVIGATYSGTNTAPTNGLLVQGKVGIGTTSPLDTLDVNGDIRVRGADIKDAGGTARITLTDNGRLDLKEDGGATALSIATNGNVGIWTTTPSEKMEVNGTVKASAFIGDGSQLTGISAGKWAEGGTGIIYYNDGNVGIGTAEPLKKLHISDIGWQAQFRVERDKQTIDLNPNTGTGANVIHSSKHIALYDGNGYLMLRNGSVGIGLDFTETPSYALHTNGTSYAVTRAGGGIDYAEYFESLDGKEIKVGTSVVLQKGKIRKAKKNEQPFGVISANPLVVGGVHPEWPHKYLRDEFGAVIVEKQKEEIMVPKKVKEKRERQKVELKPVEEEVTRTEIVKKKNKYCRVEVTEKVKREVEEPVFEEVDLFDEKAKKVIGRHRMPVMEKYEEEVDVFDDDGNPVMVGSGKFETKERPKLNPDYDEKKEYVPREDRPEWNCVGLLGQLHLRKGQPVAPTWIKIKDISDEVELWLVK